MIASLSGLALLAACPGSASLPKQRRTSEAADLGSAIHEWIERSGVGADGFAVELAASRWRLDEHDAGRLAFVAQNLRLPVPANALHELALGLWPDGSVRRIEGARGTYRDEGQLVGGTVDICWAEPKRIRLLGDGTATEAWCPLASVVYVVEIKTGDEDHVQPVGRNAQLRAQALLVSRWLSGKGGPLRTVIPAICYVNAAECAEAVAAGEVYEGRWEVGAPLEAAALDAIEVELRAVLARAEGTAEDLEQRGRGRTRELVLGPHCEFCDARAACPAFTAEALMLADQSTAPDMLPPYIGGIMPDRAAYVAGIIPAMRRMLDAAERAVQAHVEAHGPLTLADGKVYGPEVEPTESFRTDETLGVLEDALGSAAALTAFHATEDRIKAAMREGLGLKRLGRGAWDEMKSRIEDAGGIEAGSRVVWRRRWPAEVSDGVDRQVEHGGRPPVPGRMGGVDALVSDASDGPGIHDAGSREGGGVGVGQRGDDGEGSPPRPGPVLGVRRSARAEEPYPLRIEVSAEAAAAMRDHPGNALADMMAPALPAEPLDDPNEAGSSVDCVVCNKPKAPTGRSVAAESASGYCDHDCPGYRCQPLPGSLWPGETRAEFGFACSSARELAGVGPVYKAACESCGKPVEEARWVYAHPTCYACLPPPEPLPLVQGGPRPDFAARYKCPSCGRMIARHGSGLRTHLASKGDRIACAGVVDLHGRDVPSLA